MLTEKSTSPVPVARRIDRFSYAIRNIVAEARAVQARGQPVRYMNIGDPVAAGFETPPHMIEAAQRAMRDGHNGYLPSAGLLEAREAVAAEYSARGVAVSPSRVLITDGTSEGIDIALNALVNGGDEVLPCATATTGICHPLVFSRRARPWRRNTRRAASLCPRAES